MNDKRFEDVLADLRSRAAGEKAWPNARAESDALTRALHEIDVYHAELVIQNQDLLETQTALAVARDRYRHLFEDAPAPILSLSHKGIVLDANRAAEKLLGREGLALTGRPFVVRLAEGEADTFFRHMSAVCESTVPQTAELTVRGEGRERRRVVLRTALLAREKPATLLCHLTDVTEQRAATDAKEALAKRLQEAEKLEAIGRVAANIAHEVNNLLASVISLAEYSRAAVEAPTPLSRDLDELIEGAWRGARLMRGLLGLARGSAATPRPFDVARLLESVSSMLRYKKPKVNVVLEAVEGPAIVSGDEDEMLQALLNVGTNGLEAMSEGVLNVRGWILPSHKPNESRIVRITIRDEGVGMNEEQCLRAFEPLFTTKAATGGSGLGLTLVHNAVLKHRGTIDLESHPKKGTLVTIDLPLDRERAGYVPRLEPRPDALAGTLLVVDDDDGVRAATKRQLESAGASVHAFPDGVTAHEAVQKGLRFDAAVIDVNMPGWSGPELVEQLQSTLGQTVPIVLLTGAAGDLIPAALLKSNHIVLVRKPWTRRELVENVRNVIGALARTEG
jgi:two-component system, cell cycle sensor histidine kinase and response regulator CckA